MPYVKMPGETEYTYVTEDALARLGAVNTEAYRSAMSDQEYSYRTTGDAQTQFGNQTQFDSVWDIRGKEPWEIGAAEQVTAGGETYTWNPVYGWQKQGQQALSMEEIESRTADRPRIVQEMPSGEVKDVTRAFYGRYGTDQGAMWALPKGGTLLWDEATKLADAGSSFHQAYGNTLLPTQWYQEFQNYMQTGGAGAGRPEVERFVDRRGVTNPDGSKTYEYRFAGGEWGKADEEDYNKYVESKEAYENWRPPEPEPSADDQLFNEVRQRRLSGRDPYGGELATQMGWNTAPDRTSDQSTRPEWQSWGPDGWRTFAQEQFQNQFGGLFGGIGSFAAPTSAASEAAANAPAPDVSRGTLPNQWGTQQEYDTLVKYGAVPRGTSFDQWRQNAYGNLMQPPAAQPAVDNAAPNSAVATGTGSSFAPVSPDVAAANPNVAWLGGDVMANDPNAAGVQDAPAQMTPQPGKGGNTFWEPVRDAALNYYSAQPAADQNAYRPPGKGGASAAPGKGGQNTQPTATGMNAGIGTNEAPQNQPTVNYLGGSTGRYRPGGYGKGG